MDFRRKGISDPSSSSSSRLAVDGTTSLTSEAPSGQFDPAASLLYAPRGSPSLTGISPLGIQSDICERDRPSRFEPETYAKFEAQGWDPEAMLASLSLLEQKIHQVQDIVSSIGNPSGDAHDPAVQQLVVAELTCVIIQLITAAGSLLPSAKKPPAPAVPAVDELVHLSRNGDRGDVEDAARVEDPESKDTEDGGDGPYEVLQLEEEEILAPHTHFCEICGKGFKRDANLRMHMRGHGDEYKTPAALAKPSKDPSAETTAPRRYSCPVAGCRRNKEHKKFQPLKTILCVKNHYKRSHCDKRYTCGRCRAKKFSVLADLKTHEKHCGREKWVCSCGTTFSRKDKLFGHVALFQGHAPALAVDESIAPRGKDDEEARDGGAELDYALDASLSDVGEFSLMNFDAYGLPAIDEFSSQGFGAAPEASFCFPAIALSGFAPRNDHGHGLG